MRRCSECCKPCRGIRCRNCYIKLRQANRKKCKVCGKPCEYNYHASCYVEYTRNRNKELYLEIQNLYISGMSIGKLAERYNCNYFAMYMRVKKMKQTA